MIEREQWELKNRLQINPLGMLDHRKELNAGSQQQKLRVLCASSEAGG